MAICQKCGNQFPDGTSFCPMCGAPASAQQEAPVQQETPIEQEAPVQQEVPQYQPPQYQAPQYQPPQYQAPQYQPPQYQAPQYQQPAAPQYQPPQYQPPYQPQYQPVQVVDPSDHTADYDPEDISENKIMAMAAYLLGMAGVIVALLAGSKSKYASFHVRQALKLEIVNTVLGIASVVLCWTFIVPIVVVIAMVALFVIRIILFVNVCCGKAKDAPLLSKIKFLN